MELIFFRASRRSMLPKINAFKQYYVPRAWKQTGTGRYSDSRCSDNRCSDSRYSDSRCSDNRCSDNQYSNNQWFNPPPSFASKPFFHSRKVTAIKY